MCVARARVILLCVGSESKSNFICARSLRGMTLCHLMQQPNAFQGKEGERRFLNFVLIQK